jgi:hypothetical protein
MSDTVQLPIAHMSEKARTLQNQADNLAAETSSHVQQMQEYHSSLPGSMQSTFGDFISGVQQRLSNGLKVHAQISKLLSDAANASESTDADLASSFKGFTD